MKKKKLLEKSKLNTEKKQQRVVCHEPSYGPEALCAPFRYDKRRPKVGF